MGCASGKPSSKKAKEQANENKVENAVPKEPPSHSFINIQVQKTEPQVITLESDRHFKEGSVKEAQEIQSKQAKTNSQVAAPGKQSNKTELSRKQLLKKYDIKVNNNAQRVLPVNSYRYDILLPHNPQIVEGESQAQANPPTNKE